MPLGTAPPEKPATGLKTQVDNLHSRLNEQGAKLTNHKELIDELNSVFKQVENQIASLDTQYKELHEYVQS